MTEIVINPAIVSEENSQGLCGKWSKNENIKCNFIDTNGDCISNDNTEKILSRWRFNQINTRYTWWVTHRVLYRNGKPQVKFLSNNLSDTQ